MELDVLFVGSCCVDFISYVPNFPKPGETVHGQKFMTAFGGKAANQTVMAARLGANVALVAKVGDDQFGKDTIQNFKTNGVSTEFIQQATGASTGVVLVTVDREGQNSFISVKGSNNLLTPTDVNEKFKAVKEAKVVVSEMEIRGESTLTALQRAKEIGSLTLLNPSPGITSLHSEFYKLSDIICLNHKETEPLTGLPVTNVDEAKKAALVLLEKQCQKVIITLGKDGAVLATAEDKTAEHIPVDPVTPVDTTGAGDCFLGAIAFYSARFPDLPMSEIVRRSNKIAALSVLSSGTQLSYPWRKDLPPDIFS